MVVLIVQYYYIAKQCLKYPFCPLYSLEKRHQVWLKIKRKELKKEEKKLDAKLEAETSTASETNTDSNHSSSE